MDGDQLNDLIESFEARLMQRVENIFDNGLESQIRDIFLNAPPPAESSHGEIPNDSLRPEEEQEQPEGDTEREDEQQHPQAQPQPQPQQEPQPCCAICSDPISITTLCSHIFHLRCLEPWVLKNKNCPLCRRVLSIKVQMDRDQLNDLIECFEARLMQRVENILSNELVPRIHDIFLNTSAQAEPLHGEPTNDSSQCSDEVKQGEELADGEAERDDGQQNPQPQPQQESQPCCAICSDPISISTPCNHTFHLGCLEPWVLEKGTCPYCRKTICMEDITLPD